MEHNSGFHRHNFAEGRGEDEGLRRKVVIGEWRAEGEEKVPRFCVSFGR